MTQSNHPPLPDTIVVAYVCMDDALKFHIVNSPGATLTSRSASARTKCMLHIMNTHKGLGEAQSHVVEEFIYTVTDTERYAANNLPKLNRYHHRWCGTLMADIGEVIAHMCPID